MKAEYLEDLGLYRLRLPSGGQYFVDGKVITGYTDITTKNPTSIKKISTTSIVTHYEDCDGHKKSVVVYDEEADRLRNKGTYIGDELKFEELDDEYAYKKFLKKWIACRRDVVQHSDSIPVEIIKSQYKSGSAHIATVLGTEDEYGLFVYDRYRCVKDTVASIFTSLGMTFSGNIPHAATESKKVWGNATHSCCEYVTAFNKYPLGRAWDIRSGFRGTLLDCKAKQQSDEDNLNRILRAGYATHFAKDINIDTGKVVKEITSLKGLVLKISSKQKTYAVHQKAKKLITNIVTQLEDMLAKQTISKDLKGE